MAPAAFSPLGRAHVLLRMLRPSKWLRPCWTRIFEHSLIIFLWVSVTYMLVKLPPQQAGGIFKMFCLITFANSSPQQAEGYPALFL